MEIFNALVDGMTGLMNWLYQLTVQVGVPSYGIAIILLTVLIKMLLYPLTQKQMKSMVVMQKLQPKVKQIQDKWKNKDPKKMQQMIMDLYKENNANPMAGCLPLLIQLPILIALYRSLYAFPFINEAHASFIWVQNLSGTDPYYILPLLAGITTFLQSKMTTSMTDPTQKTMLYMMPLIIVWISATVPAGLALYWVVFNVVGAIQQYFINKQTMPVKEGASGR
ncbi:YidC/Oxa1 family membrane protein insertase [Pelotomaculum sp. PtaB.Bin117]|uniref:YidC/Oxa1 family membrane protein insertase n=1 Tax=Pelotomaculum sp. PtaB.Bin117 TaxID=1811694 RepID=UPI0009C58B6F|nr:YidC/Oxa1 family membrane protein insertase [Pelotomaculum sp. PtaB.Bin117]OPX85715.1 MAG: Membrane protein insertase YidC [Pelotomaculum sp. PtaB.Bin117]OPY61413.1 MAG: Membrane protein insertase YidC [Pelotomaculum sp. PtaU1.Bin065]